MLLNNDNIREITDAGKRNRKDKKKKSLEKFLNYLFKGIIIFFLKQINDNLINIYENNCYKN